MKLRSALLMALGNIFCDQDAAEAARHLGVTQPRTSEPLPGRINLFGLDTLVSMPVASAGSDLA